MRRFVQTLCFALSISGLALFAEGCVVTSDSTAAPAPVGSGRLEVHWTIFEGEDPASCASQDVGFVRVDVLDLNGNKVNTGADTQSCNTFATSFAGTFTQGTYTVQATLLANDGVTPRTTTASTLVTIPGNGATATVTVDFPSNSFLASAATGDLEVHWTLAEAADPSACTAYSVANVRVDVVDASGRKVNSGSDTQTCTALATSFATSFPVGAYTVQVTMLAADGTARTTTATATANIVQGTTATVTVDFPSSSFF